MPKQTPRIRKSKTDATWRNYLAANRQGQLIESPLGFLVVSRPNADSLWIEDLWVSPEHRGAHAAPALADIAASLALTEGRSQLWGDIVPSSPTAEVMHELMTKYGFELTASTPILNIYRKFLHGQPTRHDSTE